RKYSCQLIKFIHFQLKLGNCNAFENFATAISSIVISLFFHYSISNFFVLVHCLSVVMQKRQPLLLLKFANGNLSIFDLNLSSFQHEIGKYRCQKVKDPGRDRFFCHKKLLIFSQNKQDTACLLSKVKPPLNNRREGVSLTTWYHKQRTMRQNENHAANAELKFLRSVAESSRS